MVADKALAIVSRRDARNDFVTANGTEFHRKGMGNGDASVSPGGGILERSPWSAVLNGACAASRSRQAFRAIVVARARALRFRSARVAPAARDGVRMQIGDAIEQAPEKQKAHR
ncbi:MULTISPECIES: hypothetical protein [Burkholderia]|uniref:hypothetical protein n=1 Tax=Burkholderia TaxID=32008 RepID=UPI0018D208FA|nr:MULTISPECIES: hypothetical protein [Burkholderia]